MKKHVAHYALSLCCQPRCPTYSRKEVSLPNRQIPRLKLRRPRLQLLRRLFHHRKPERGKAGPT